MHELKKLKIEATARMLELLNGLTGRDAPFLETSIVEQRNHDTQEINDNLKFAADAPRLNSFSLSSDSV